MVNVVSIIARAGSKGLKRKAMIPLGGKPLVAWTIENALAAKMATAVGLTSDGEDILDVGRKYAIEVFDRSGGVSDDNAVIDAPVRDMVLKWEARHGKTADNVVILYANIPVRPIDLIDRSLTKLIETGCDSVQSVYQVGKVHPYWMKKLGGAGHDVLMMYQENNVFRRQDLPPVYMLNGGIIALTRKNLFNHDPTAKDPHRIFGTDRRAVVTGADEVVDVDDSFDLAFAEAVIKIRGLAQQRAQASPRETRVTKILTVLGARPQFIKAAAVSQALASHPGVTELLLHTGQHYDPALSDVFFDELGLPAPAFHLGVGSAPHGVQTARIIEGVEGVLEQVKPDWVLVYGDTNSTLGGALAAAKLNLPIAHVEAGLRSYNRRMPEEINRVLTDHLSALLLAPADRAVANLQREGIHGAGVRVVGDVMYDAALHFAERSLRRSTIAARLGLRPGRYILATIHRAENTDVPQRLQDILTALTRVAQQTPVILPLHPRTRAKLAGSAPIDGAGSDRLRIIEPVGFLDMISLERQAALIATDSGGVQKEAYFYHVPCVTLRDETEWVELVEAGCNRVCPPTSADAVERGIGEALAGREQVRWPVNLYGDGHASVRVADALVAGAG